MSRKRGFEAKVSIPLSLEVIKRYRKEFDTPSNLIIRNALAQGEIEDVVTDIDFASTINHIFVNSLKKKGVKASCQGHSGRCWMFAGLNMFRHMMIETFDLKDFEFSGTYLYFWDKIERANRFLDDILSTLDLELIDTELTENRGEHLLILRLKEPITDGGYWGTFANLVSKYGLVPKSAMPERMNSYFSGQFNQVLNSILRSHAYYIRSNYQKKDLQKEGNELLRYKDKVMQQIYDVCVKFLGKPPEKFDWSIQQLENENNLRIIDWTPQKFSSIIFKEISIHQFIVIGNFPTLVYHRLYEYAHNPDMTISYSEGLNSPVQNYRILNLPIRDLEKYGYKSIQCRLPVWFACDVNQELHQRTSSFSKDVMKHELIFGKVPALTKADRNRYQVSIPNHAMCFVGVDHRNNQEMPFIWQVENSWGYSDHETPGEDGFYVMTDDWFRDHVYEIVIHSKLLTKKDFEILNTKPTIIPFGSLII